MSAIDLDRTITLEHTVRSQAWRVDELLRRIAILECEPERIVLAEWDEAFPFRLNEDTELAGISY